MRSIKVHAKNTPSPMPIIGIESEPDQNKENRIDRIAKTAYYRAEARGFQPGHEMEDWFAAETEEM